MPAKWAFISHGGVWGRKTVRTRSDRAVPMRHCLLLASSHVELLRGSKEMEYDRIRLLQRQIMTLDHTEARLERDISDLTAANKQLQAELIVVNEQLQHERKQAGGSSKKKAAELIAANKQLKREVAKLTAENKQLQGEVAEQVEASSNGMEGRDEKRPSRVEDVVRKVPWRMRVKGRGRLLKGLSNAGNRLMAAGDRTRVSQTEDMLCTPKSVKAKSPMRLLDELAEEIVDLNAQIGISADLDAKLEAVQQARDEFDANNNTETVNALRVFINAVQTDQGQDDESLQERAEDLIDAAQEIVELIDTYYV